MALSHNLIKGRSVWIYIENVQSKIISRENKAVIFEK